MGIRGSKSREVTGGHFGAGTTDGRSRRLGIFLREAFAGPMAENARAAQSREGVYGRHGRS